MSNDKDIMVGSTINIPTGPPVKVAPSYLVKISGTEGAKNKTAKLFLAIEQPQFNTDFIHTKGFFTDATEDDIVTGYREMVAAATQAQIIEMWIPWHTIQFVRSLVFKTANKK